MQELLIDQEIMLDEQRRSLSEHDDELTGNFEQMGISVSNHSFLVCFFNPISQKNYKDTCS